MAKKPTTNKESSTRTYVLPELGVSVEASNVEQAIIKAKKKAKEQLNG